MPKFVCLLALLFAAGAAAGAPSSHHIAPGHAPARKLGPKPLDDKYDLIYDGKIHRVESLGPMEFEAVNSLEKSAQLDQLAGLVRQFKRAVADAQAHMKSKMRELDLFLKP